MFPASKVGVEVSIENDIKDSLEISPSKKCAVRTFAATHILVWRQSHVIHRSANGGRKDRVKIVSPIPSEE